MPVISSSHYSSFDREVWILVSPLSTIGGRGGHFEAAVFWILGIAFGAVDILFSEEVNVEY
jgi:hypothetical protein